MAPVIPTTVNSISLTPCNILISRKNNLLTRCSVFQKPGRQALSTQRYAIPFSTPVRLFPHLRVGFDIQPKLRTPVVSSAETDVAVEEADSPTVDKSPTEAPENSPDVPVKSDASPTPAPSRRSRPARKSEMPPIKNEDLIPGATFTGKVRSIQPFGAFVDFGAFTDGLVHVSNLSNSFVKDVTSVVSVGQEVTVRLLEVNMETGRISLTMRESDETSRQKQPKDAPGSSDKSRAPKRTPQRNNQRRDDAKKTSKFVKGQDLEGTVKNLTRSGAFISLPEGEEGFLPTSEMADEGFGEIMGGSSLQVGQEVSVRVLRITRGQATLTMKKEEATGELDSVLNQGVVYKATNPFLLAFRKNKEISAFLDKREEEVLAEKAEKDNNEAGVDISTVDDTLSETVEKDGEVTETINEDKDAKAITTTTDQLSEEPSAAEDDNLPETVVQDEEVVATTDEDKDVNSHITDSLEEANGASQNIVEESEASSETVEAEASTITTDQPSEKPSATEDDSLPITEDQLAEPEVSTTTTDQLSEEPSAINAIETNAQGETADQLAEPEVSTTTIDQLSEEPSAVIAAETDAQGETADQLAEPEVSTTTIDQISEEPSAVNAAETDAQGEEEPSGTDLLENGSTGSLSEQNAVSQDNENLTEENQISGEVVTASSVVEDAVQKETKASISPALVKQLREETGAGMMDCKKALSETGGDIAKALEYLRKKGLSTADKKASRATAEGRIGSYIHDSRIGVLIEVNCETDFVSRGDIFRELVDDLAMQVAACPQVQYLATEDVPEEIVNKEREIEMQKEDLMSKPEQIRSKIVDGRIRKRLEQFALLEQPYIKDDKVVVKDWVKQTIATIGENIKVKRFVRYNLGEGLEKKSQDFAAEVAAQTAAKSVPPPAKEEPAAAEAKETVEAPKTAVSAALVKQLREETGAGMMDCKKALSETGGDLEKAQEYLRKKGLSTADKKSSRLAAEGRIGSYIHDARIGVLIEVNCETDFVGRSEQFKELVDDLAMQVVACPQVQYINSEDIPESTVSKEKELEMQREDLQSKPENIREKIVEGRVSKRLGELTLLEQPFIKDDSVLVKDLVKQTVATLGENVKVRRFISFLISDFSSSTSLVLHQFVLLLSLLFEALSHHPFES
nr:titin-like isoform X1 [Ipomoea batatas]